MVLVMVVVVANVRRRRGCTLRGRRWRRCGPCQAPPRCRRRRPARSVPAGPAAPIRAQHRIASPNRHPVRAIPMHDSSMNDSPVLASAHTVTRCMHGGTNHAVPSMHGVTRFVGRCCLKVRADWAVFDVEVIVPAGRRRWRRTAPRPPAPEPGRLTDAKRGQGRIAR